jgi:hypothetical protein
MSYGALRAPGYEARLAEEKAAQADRAKEAQAHVAALLRGVQAQEATGTVAERVAKTLEALLIASERIAIAQERIAAAQERAGKPV